jgi:hypothetical protein
MTDTETETAPAASVPAVETSEPAPEAPEQAAQAPGEDEEPEEEGPRRPSRTQRYQRRIALLAAENDELRRRASWQPPAAAGWPERPPQEAEFGGDSAAYERALNAHHVRQAAREAVQQEAERERGERLVGLVAHAAEAHREHVAAHLDRVEELKQRVPDFSDALKVAATIAMREEVLDEILRSENSALVQYYLAKNPEKARALNGLSGHALARAVGRLEGAVRLPARRATGATPPVQPLTGAAGPSFDPARAEMAAYAADYRRRQQARQRS